MSLSPEHKGYKDLRLFTKNILFQLFHPGSPPLRQPHRHLAALVVQLACTEVRGAAPPVAVPNEIHRANWIAYAIVDSVWGNLKTDSLSEPIPSSNLVKPEPEDAKPELPVKKRKPRGQGNIQDILDLSDSDGDLIPEDAFHRRTELVPGPATADAEPVAADPVAEPEVEVEIEEENMGNEVDMAGGWAEGRGRGRSDRAEEREKVSVSVVTNGLALTTSSPAGAQSPPIGFR